MTQASFLYRVRFLLGGRHGEFKFLPPPGYAACYEAVLPKEKLKVEHSREYKQERTYTRDLLGPTVSLTQAAFTPVPVDTSQVQIENTDGHQCTVVLKLGLQPTTVHFSAIQLMDLIK